MKKRIRIQGMFIFLVVLLFIMFARFTIASWKEGPADEFFDIVGILSVLFGFLLRIVARGHKEETSHGGSRLVINGPYSLMRNPMYFGTLLIGTGVIAILLRLWTLLIFLIIYFSIYIPQVNKEEKILLERFGEDYKNYCKSVSKYFPNIRGLSDFKNYIFLLKLSWLKKELVPLIATITAIFIIEIWQDVKLFGFSEFFDEILELSLVILIFTAVIFLLAFRKNNKQHE
ncbi:MAG: isoprenylcysteine carboxylmethyltransferase family protein [Candidatus Omnitrophota bacterium]